MINRYLNVKLTALSATVPEETTELSNYSKLPQAEALRIIKSTGVERIRRIAKEQDTLDLCLKSFDSLLEKKAVNLNEIDAIVFVTRMLNHRSYRNTSNVHAKYKFRKDVACFDLDYGCAGFIAGLNFASMLVSTGSAKKVLLLAGVTTSKAISPADYNIDMVFSDAGSASIIEYSKGDFLSSSLEADGSGQDSLVVKEWCAECGGDDAFIKMKGPEVASFVMGEIPQSIQEMLDFNQKSKENIHFFFLHQANQYLLDFIGKKMKIEKEKIPSVMKDFGNTGCASLPLTIVMSKKLLTNENSEEILLTGFGSGYTWGSCLLSLKDTFIDSLNYLPLPGKTHGK